MKINLKNIADSVENASDNMVHSIDKVCDNFGKVYLALFLTFTTPIIGASIACFTPKIKLEDRIKILKSSWYIMSEIPISDLYKCHRGNKAVQAKYDPKLNEILS